MDARRAFGHLTPPTADQLDTYIARLGLQPGSPDRCAWTEAIASALEGLDRLEELDEPAVELRHVHRDPGRPPRRGEDPYNAVIRFCDVRGSAEGPLAGMRFGVKDCIAVAGVPMTNGGRRMPAHVPTEDAVVVERLLDAGAAITAKLNLDDSGLGLGEGSAFGAARNPRAPDHSTGGSSSGSGAAVAAGLVDAALAADEGGSIRIPAAWCGLVGMKATHGVVPTYGMTYLDHTLDHIGPITRTVGENARILETIAGADWRDPQWVRADPRAQAYSEAVGRSVAGLRVGVIAESVDGVGCDREIAEAFAAAQATLRELGASLEAASVAHWPQARAILNGVLVFALWAMVQSGGAGFGHLGRIDPQAVATTRAQFLVAPGDLPPRLKTALLTAEHLRDAYLGVHYAKAQNLRLELRRQIDALFQDFDVLLTPTTPVPPFRLLAGRATAAQVATNFPRTASANTCPLDLSGHPALTVPCGTTAQGLPIGLQIIGPRFGEAIAYRVGAAFESASPAPL